MAKLDKTTQVFRDEIKAPITIAAGAVTNTSPSSWPSQTFEVKAYTAGDMVLAVGPLDRTKFQIGDRLKIIVQRVGKRKRGNNS